MARGLRGNSFLSRKSRASSFTFSRSSCIGFFLSWLSGLRRYAAVNPTPQPFGVAPTKRRRCAAFFFDIRPFNRARQSFPIAYYQLFHRRNPPHTLPSILSTNRLKLPKYSSTLPDRLGGSKIE